VTGARWRSWSSNSFPGFRASSCESANYSFRRPLRLKPEYRWNRRKAHKPPLRLSRQPPRRIVCYPSRGLPKQQSGGMLIPARRDCVFASCLESQFFARSAVEG
jgi:hypothetical protein